MTTPPGRARSPDPGSTVDAQRQPWATDRLAPDRLAIFLLHSVVPEPAPTLRNGSGKHLDAASFRAIIESLCAQGRAISMDDVVDHVQHARPFPPRAFAVTFDDGFENNASVAAPILRELDVPATFYVTTGFIDANRMSWIDRIEHCLQQAAPGALELPWLTAPHPFRTDGDRLAVLETIREHVKGDPDADGDALADRLFRQCGVPPVTSRSDDLDRKMAWDQVRELAADELFTVGGHSHTHRVLTYLTPAELDAEIRTSLDRLREHAGVEPRHYSYPEGQPWCSSSTVVESLRGHGVVCAPTAIDGLNDLKTGLFRLRRINVVAC